MFDGSSIAGWKAINESDMLLMPDCATAVLDPFAAQTSLIIFCDVHEPLTGQPYGRDPRSIAKKAQSSTWPRPASATRPISGPRPSSSCSTTCATRSTMNTASYEIDSEEGPWVSAKQFPDGNTGHRPPIKGGYFPVPPVDGASDLRAEMLSVMADMGLEVEKHHHEVAPSQHELGIVFSTAGQGRRQHADLQIRRAQRRPPVRQDRDLHAEADQGRQRLGHACPPVDLEGRASRSSPATGYADLSETALYYIGGIIKHAKAINAFTNPTTNSYKRLIPGFEAPVLLAYSARNRSASCRIPIVSSPKGKRVEVRFPDPAANPYLGFAAMLMAGLDGIQNKIHPGEPMDKNLYDLPPEELKDVPTVCGSLREAIGALEADHAFLTKGDVFTTDLIEGYIELHWEEVYNFEHTPHPIEFQMYYSV